MNRKELVRRIANVMREMIFGNLYHLKTGLPYIRR